MSRPADATGAASVSGVIVDNRGFQNYSIAIERAPSGPVDAVEAGRGAFRVMYGDREFVLNNARVVLSRPGASTGHAKELRVTPIHRAPARRASQETLYLSFIAP